MTFVVEPQALSAYAAQLGRAADDLAAIKGYVGRHTHDGVGGELFSIATEGHDHALGIVNSTLDRLAGLLAASGTELAGAANYYVRADTAAAAALDARMPTSAKASPTDLQLELWSISEALGGVVKALIDSAIIAGVGAAAGTATCWTGAGAVVGYGVAAAEVVNMLRLWGQATRLYQSASAAVLAFRSTLGYHLSDLESVRLPAVPAAAYNHPFAPYGPVR